MSYIDFNKGNKVKVWDGIKGPIYHSEQCTIGHFTLEKGTYLPEHNHPHEQWTNLISGALEFDIDGEKIVLTPGMTAFIPPNLPHSGFAVTECKVIDCFLPAREDFKQLEKEQFGTKSAEE